LHPPFHYYVWMVTVIRDSVCELDPENETVG